MTDPARQTAQAIGFDQSPDLQFVTAGAEQRIVACNTALRRLVGADVTGELLADALGSTLGDPVLELVDEVVRTGETHRLDGWQVHAARSGEWAHADLTLSPWRDELGQVAGCLGRVTEAAQRAPVQEAANSRYSDALDLVTNLQDALLPVALPVAPALDVAATYLLATDDARAGGDWFDAIVRPDGTVALVVGDTVGQGVQASAVMGQLRAVLHGRLLSDEPISESLRALDRYARLHPESRAATVCVVVVDPASGSVEYCTAGHPPPLVVAGDGTTRFLSPSGAGPLTTETDYPTARTRVAVEDLLLLYTDGLSERPGLTPSQSADEIARAAAWSAVGAEPGDPTERRSVRVCERTLEVLTRQSGYTDDITLLAAHRTASFPPYRTTIARSSDAVRVAREELDGWLADLQVALLDEFAVLHAVGELITNAVEHAYAEGDARADAVELSAEVDPDGFLVCTVTDHGQWNDTAPHPDRGRGLGMVSGLVDMFNLARSDHGTTATFRKRLTRTAEVLTGSQAPVAAGVAGPVPFATEVRGDLMTVRGPLDLSTADNFRATLRRFSRGGTAEITVDLGGVTHLGSAGVQVLHEVRAMDGAPLHLRAPSGSVAQHVLELVRLPYDE